MEGWALIPTLPPLGAGEAHLWRLLPSPEGVDLSLLAPDERARADRFRFDPDRLQFVATRTTLRRLLSRYLAVPPQALAFAQGPHGKPRLASQFGDRLRFNVSHSAGAALLAFALDQEIGTDVENHLRRTNVDALLPTVCTRSEQESLRALGPAERRAAFFGMWTGKEAVLKALGSGLSVSPARMELLPLPWRAACRVRVEGQGGGIFEACPLAIGPEISGAFASAGPPMRLRLYHAPAG